MKRTQLIAVALAAVYFLLAFNAFACLVPLYGGMEVAPGSDCAMPSEQPARQHCEAFKSLSVQTAPQALQAVDLSAHTVVAVESRGLVFGAPLADRLKAGLVLIRKAGKLPHKTIQATYALEYGEGILEVHADSLSSGTRVVLVDDLLATGGTMAATLRLIEQLGGQVVGVEFLIELAFLHGREKLKNYPVHSLIIYD
jgi:adenine phosphoribosyltransferase